MYRIRPARARVLLEKLLAHEDWQFRAAATWACGAIGSPELEQLALQMRKDPHPSVRFNALRAATAIRQNVRTDCESQPQPAEARRRAPQGITARALERRLTS
jgi:HEAT repeat protein